MEKIREFGVLKWLVFPSMSLVLAAIVAWFNVTVFGWKDGAFYIAAVVIIAAFSIAINKYVGSESSRLAVAAFVFEILLILVLGANAIYSLSIQREMAVARMAEATRSEDLKTASKLRSRQAQRDATRMIADDRKTGRSSQQIFAENERMLLWVMAGELLAYIVAAFSLYALSHLGGLKQPTAQPQPVRVPTDERQAYGVRTFQSERPQIATASTRGRTLPHSRRRQPRPRLQFEGHWFAQRRRRGATARIRSNPSKPSQSWTDRADDAERRTVESQPPGSDGRAVG